MIEIDGKRIEVDIIHKDMLNMYLRIKEGRIVVTCPYLMPDYKVYQFINSRKDWIRDHLQRMERKKSFIYDGGDEFRLFGDNHPILFQSGNKSCNLINGKIIVSSRTDDRQKLIPFIYQNLNGLLYQKGLFVMEKHLQMLRDYGYDQTPSIEIKKLKGKWGLCYTRENRIVISSYLIHYPMIVLEAIVVHELAHFIVNNHSKRFYAVVRNELAEYDNAIKMLK